MKDRNWDVYQAFPNGRRREKARVTIGTNRAILMNQHAYEAFGTPPSVELMFDAERRLIGMRPCDPHKKNAYPIKPTLQGKHHIVYAGGFLTHINLKTERTILFDEIDIDPDGTIVLDLTKTIYVTRGSRN